MGVVLWHIELSHYSEKARWALDHKGIAYERRTPMPGLHGARALIESRGVQRRLPVLELDGRRIGDSTAIIAALEQRFPDPPLYPEDPGERARALDLEDWFDEQLGPHLRRFAWFHTLQDRDETGRALFRDGSPGRRRLLRATFPVARSLVRRDYRIDAAGAEASRAAVLAAMDRLETELRPSGYLAGDAFSVADLTAAALFTPVIGPPERPFLPSAVVPGVEDLRKELTARPGGRWVLDVYSQHRGAYAAEVVGRR